MVSRHTTWKQTYHMGRPSEPSFERCYTSGMKWTKETPKVAGFYWFRGLIGDPRLTQVHDFRSEPSVIKIHRSPLGLHTKILGDGAWPLIDTAKGEWAGPFDPPDN